MIQSSFYPTDYSVVATNAEMTKNIPDLDLGPVFSNAYYLGWIKPENLPAPFHRSIIESRTEDETTVYTFKDMNPTDTYYDCGYLTLSPTGLGYSTSQAFRYLYYDENLNSWTGTRTALSRLPNKLNVMYEGIARFQVTFEGYIYNTNDEFVSRYSFLLGFNAENLYKFLKGESSIDHTITSYQTNMLINAADFDGTSAYIPTEDGNYRVRLFITGYNFGQERSANQSHPQSGQIGASVMFYTRIPYDDLGDVIMTGNASPSHSGFSYTSAVGYTFADGQILVGGLTGELRLDELSSLTSPYQTDSYPYITNDRILARRTDNNRIAWLIPLYTIDDLLHAFGLLVRASNYTDTGTNIYYTPIYGYQETSVYAPYVTPNDEFTATVITGDLEDEDFKAKLRPWQYDVDEWDKNEYTEDDKPEYIPEEGDTTDDDEGTISLNTPGSLGATNAFVTRYVLNTQQINRIGRNLWSTLGDGNELTWKNFFLTISGSEQIDYSLTLSEVISYFISLKYFPFDLSSISISTGESGIRVGTGATLIEAGSNTKTISDGIIRLDGGRCTIPNKWRNYLDLEPYATASIYIPYCGTTEIPMSVISGEQLGITYLVDMTTGAMTAVVMKYSGSGAHFPIAVMNGSCGFDILVTGTNGNSQMTNAITNLASKATQWTGQVLQSGITGIMGGAGSGTGGGSGAGAAAGMISTALSVGQDMLQNNIQMPKLYATAPMTSGSSSSLSSLILPQTAYVQIRRHNPYASRSNYKSDMGILGYRSAYTGTIASANGMGFVKCQNPNLTSVSQAGATEKEINMIKSLLSDGIFT